MPVDARPFLQLVTASGAVIKCARPVLRPLALGITGSTGGVAQDAPTHTIDVYVALGTPPADLADNAVVTVDVEKGKPREAFRILRSGVDKGAGVWTLYVRPEEGYVPPVSGGDTGADDGGYWGTV